MKIGFKTRIWGINIDNINPVLKIITDFGFQGVEFSQRPDSLGVNNINELSESLKKHNLSFLSLTCGTLIERRNFLRAIRPEYFYLKYGDLASITSLAQEGFKPVFHPGVFTPIRGLSESLPLLENNPELNLICDTAHMTIAGDSFRSYMQIIDRVSAIHIKDWSPEFGRSGPRFGRGFKKLGFGVIDWDYIIGEIKEKNYEGWLVIEIENNEEKDLLSTVRACAEWLSTYGLFHNENKYYIVKQPIHKISKKYYRKCPADIEASFREKITEASTKRPVNFYTQVAKAYSELIPSKLVSVWTFSPSQDYLGLLICYPPIIQTGKLRRSQDLLTGIAIDRQAVITEFDLSIKHPGEKYGDSREPNLPRKIQELNPRKMISIPIYNSGNQNYVKFVINVFPKDDMEPSISVNEMYKLSKAVTIAADFMLDSVCSLAVTKVNLLASKHFTVKEFLQSVMRLVQETLKCEGVGIFIVNRTEDKLEYYDSIPGTNFCHEDEKYYLKGEGLTGNVWKRNEPLLTTDCLEESEYLGKSAEFSSSPGPIGVIMVPFRTSKGIVMGIIRCNNKKSSPSFTMPNLFIDDDVAILDSIGQALVPHLQILLEESRRAKALGKLTHELIFPLVAIRGAAEFIIRNKEINNILDYDYPGDIWSWSELMRRLLGGVDIYSYENLSVSASRTLLLSEVIIPARKQVAMLARERGFSLKRINYHRFESVPALWIDRNQFQQVVFNMLSNTIKYCFDDPERFQVDIDGQKSGTNYLIKFQDWGPGIKEELKETIFIEGFRTNEAIEHNITGQGLGLWIVRQIVEAHNGTIEVTNLKNPTEFTIRLPIELSIRPPVKQESQS